MAAAATSAQPAAAVPTLAAPTQRHAEHSAIHHCSIPLRSPCRPSRRPGPPHGARRRRSRQLPYLRGRKRTAAVTAIVRGSPKAALTAHALRFRQAIVVRVVVVVVVVVVGRIEEDEEEEDLSAAASEARVPPTT